MCIRDSYYFDRTAVDFAHLVPSETRTGCPYKGRTSHYWTAQVGNTTVEDLAWSYDFPTRALSPITNLVAFYNEDVDLTVDGRLMERPGRAGHRVSQGPGKVLAHRYREPPSAMQGIRIRLSRDILTKETDWDLTFPVT